MQRELQLKSLNESSFNTRSTHDAMTLHHIPVYGSNTYLLYGTYVAVWYVHTTCCIHSSTTTTVQVQINPTMYY